MQYEVEILKIANIWCVQGGTASRHPLSIIVFIYCLRYLIVYILYISMTDLQDRNLRDPVKMA